MRIQLLVVEGARPKSVVSRGGGGGEVRAILIGCKCRITRDILLLEERYTPNLGLAIAFLVREREHSR